MVANMARMYTVKETSVLSVTSRTSIERYQPWRCHLQREMNTALILHL